MNNREFPPLQLGGPYSGPVEPEGAGITLQQVLAILFAHWRLSAVIFTCIMALSVVVIKKWPRSYTATSTLVIDFQLNDPIGGQGLPVNMLGSYIATQMEVLRSAEILDPVVSKLKLTADEQFTAGYSPKSGTLGNWVRDMLRTSIDLESGAYGSQLIHITAHSQSPIRAAQIANALAEEFVDQQVSRLAAPASQRASHYGDETQVLADRVSAIEAKVNAIRRRTGISDLAPGQGDVEQAALANLEGRYIDAQSARRAAEVRVNSELAAGAARDAPNIQALRAQLVQFDTQMAQLRTTYGSQYPKVRELQNQIDATHQALEAAVRANSNTAAQELATARDLEERLRLAVEQQRARTVQLRSVQDESSKLLLELDSARAAYKNALDELDHVQVTARSKFSNVSVMAHAEQPVRPTSPKPMKLLTAAVAGGGMAALAIPFLFDLLFRRRVRCADDIIGDLHVPLLCEFSPPTGWRGHFK